MRLRGMWWTVLPMVVMALCPATLRADGAIDKALAEAPADAVLFVCLWSSQWAAGQASL